MFSKSSIELLVDMRSSSDVQNRPDYDKLFSRDILNPFRHLVRGIVPLMYEIEPSFVMHPFLSNKVLRTKSRPFVTCYDSVKVTFSRDRKLYPFHPYIQVGITPYHYFICYGCSSVSRELMDIIRLMAINKNAAFDKAWSIIVSSSNIDLHGKRYGDVHGMGDSRFYFFPDEKIKNLLAFRDLSFFVHYEINCLINHDFLNVFKDQIISSISIYEFLLLAANSIGNFPYDPDLLTQWSIPPWELKKISLKQAEVTSSSELVDEHAFRRE